MKGGAHMKEQTWADKVRDFLFCGGKKRYGEQESPARKSDIGQVPLHRSYGVKKREGFFTHLNDTIAVAMAVCLIILLSIIWIMGIVMLVVLLGSIGILLISVAALLFVYLKLCRTLRKRLKFIFKLKRTCKRLGLKLQFKRGVLKGMKLNSQGLDFIVDSPKKRWCVRFYTPKKYLSHLTFIDKNTVEIKTNITKSRLKFVLGLEEPKTRRIPYSFAEEVASGSKKVAKALILNPVPHDVFKKDTDGATIPIGTGEYLYGYTMFSGSGFLEALHRESLE